MTTKLRHEYKHQINHCDDLVLSQRLRQLFLHDKNAGEEYSYLVTSLYFDTFYDKALIEKIEGVQKREKFRLRYYGKDISYICLEKKYKINGMCGKRKVQITYEQVRRLLHDDYEFLLESGEPLMIEFYSKIKGQGLRPKTIVRYSREAFVYAPGNVRITLDRDLRGSNQWKEFLNPFLHCVDIQEDQTILEVKYDVFLPDIVKLAVQVANRKTISNSKYVLCRKYG